MMLRKLFAGALALALLTAPALAQVQPGTSPLSGAKGGTNNAFMQFTGPAGSLKTFTLPNASGTIAVYNAIGTWTGAQSFTDGTLILLGATSGSSTLKAPATGGGVATLFPGTDTLVGKATTDTFTNKTFDTAGAGNSFSINGLAATANTGTGSVVRATSPTLVTPTLGAATATSINGNTFTTGSYTLTGGAAKTLTFSNSLTLAGTDGTTLTFQGTDTYVGRATTDTLTNKTLTSPTITTPAISGAATITSNSSSALSVGPNGATNPVLQVNGSIVSQADGIQVVGNAAGAGAGVAAISSGANTVLGLNGKGAGEVRIGNVSTGGVTLAVAGGGVTVGSALTYGGVALNNAVTGTGNMVLSTSPSLTTPNLGTPSAVTLTNATGLPIAGIASLGTNVATGLATATGSANGFARIIATGTIALGTGAISAATCATAVTSAATGTATTDVIEVGFNGDPTATTGYTPGAMLSIIPYPTTNTVNVKVCNNTGGSITPGAVTLNWRVVR